MTLGQVADLAYVRLRDQAEARAHTDRILSGLARVLSGEGDVTDPDEALAAFDAALAARPVDRDPDDAALLRELGVG